MKPSAVTACQPERVSQRPYPVRAASVSFNGRADSVRFGKRKTTEANTAGSTKPEKLGWFKSAVKRINSFLLWLLPKKLYSWLEGRLLFEGQYLSRLKMTLNEYQREVSFGQMDDTQEVTFESAPGVKNHAWYYPAQDGKPTILMSMGNCCSLGLGYESKFPLMTEGYGLLVYEYPGYGSTKGKPDEQSIYKSIEAASKFLEEKGVPTTEQILYGVSLGGGPTVELAANSGKQFKAVVLESTMTSFADVVEHSIGKWVPNWLFPLHEQVQSKFESLSKISKINSPLLVLHGENDPLMPKHFAEQLFNASTLPEGQKKLHIVPDANHCIDFYKAGYEALDFFKSLP